MCLLDVDHIYSKEGEKHAVHPILTKIRLFLSNNLFIDKRLT